MRDYLARLLLCSLLLSLSEPAAVLAQATEGASLSEEFSDTELVELTPVEAVAAANTGWPEPEQRSYGIESMLPELADTEDPTLSAKLADQSLVNLFQGGAEFNMPVTLPKGVNGLTPEVVFRYSSHQARQNGVVGFGWQLQLGSVRRVRRDPAASLQQEPEYLLALPQLQGDLTLLSSGAVVDVYGIRREREFAKVEHHKTTNHWSVTLKSGHRYELGSTAASRTQNGDGSVVTEWHIASLIDTFGNRIDYTYQITDGALYPDEIRYGGRSGGVHLFRVQFWLTPRNDPRYAYQFGFAINRRHTISQVRVYIADTERLRYRLTYEIDQLNSRSDLANLDVTGTNGDEVTTQQLQFTYYRLGDDNVGPQSNLLKSVTLPTGGTLSYHYKTAQQLRNAEGLVNQRPHTPLQVVTALTRSDFFGRQDTTRYLYRDGHYYFDGTKNRQVAGFGRVEVTDPLEQLQRSFFHQGGGYDGSELGEAADDWYLIGQRYRHELYNDQQRLIEQTITRWQSTPLGTDRSFIAPTDSLVTSMGTVGPDRSRATTTVYSPTNGNVVETTQWGEVTGNDDGSFTDMGSDSRRTEIDYARNDEKHILSLPSSERHYDQNDVLVSQTDHRYDGLALGEVATGALTHEEAHLLEESRTVVTQRGYNAFGQLTLVTDPRGHRQEIAYDTLGVQPAWSENHLGYRTLYEIDALTSRMNRVTEPNGLVTERVFDGLGREILRRQSQPLHGNSLQPVESVTYDDVSRPSSVLTETYLSLADTSRQSAYLDGFGRTVQVRRDGAVGEDPIVVSNTAYDALGRTAREELPVFSDGVAFDTSDTSPHATTTEYDPLDRITQTIDANGESIITYDGWSRTERDANGNQRMLEHDAYDRLAQVTESIEGTSFNTSYSYDSRDNLIGIIDATGSERAFDYDSVNRLILAEDLHSSGDATVGVTRWAYDDADNLTLVVDAVGRHATSVYDQLDRPTAHTFSGAGLTTETVTLMYDQGSFGTGKLSEVTSPDWHWQGTYNVRGQVITETATVLETPYSRQHDYTYFDQINSTTQPSGILVEYGYNSAGQIKHIAAAGATVASQISYNPASQVAQLDYGNGLRSVLTHAPEQMHRLTAKSTFQESNPAEKVQDLVYTFDAVGNIRTLQERADTATKRHISYQYDTVNRLRRATATGTVSADYDSSYSYDAAGNLLSSPHGSYQYQQPGFTNPQAVSAILNGAIRDEFDYDRTGNLVVQRSTGGASIMVRRHRWDSRSLLAETKLTADHSPNWQTISYGYDDQRRRIWKRNQSFTCRHDSSHGGSDHGLVCSPAATRLTVYPFEDYEVQVGDVSRIHVAANGMHVATAETELCTAGTDQSSCPTDIYYHHDDHLHGANVITDETGQIAQLLDYYPFGSSRVNEKQGAYAATQDFTGHQLDQETGLHYAQARYYFSDIGRFISHDPLAWRPAELLERFGERPQGLNFYAYALNNPIVLADPTGEFACGGLCMMLLGIGGGYLTSVSGIAIAPGPQDSQETLKLTSEQAPSLFEGFVGNVATSAEERGHHGAAGAIRAGSVVGGAIGAARNLRPVTTTKALGSFLKNRNRVESTVERINKGIKHKHDHDDTVFENRFEGFRRLLPKKSDSQYYREYVDSDRLFGRPGPRRIIRGKQGETYYSPDHYTSRFRIDRWLPK